jgi:8-amino-7-oxononanoate synthase
MDGDIADVQTLAGLCQATSSWLMIDDAHGFGVLGEQGAGLCQTLKLSQQEVPILMATLGKAVGVSGAFVAGSEDLIETLIQQARSYIFTTASPPANAAAVMQSIDIIRNESWRRDKLQQLISYFRQQMTQQGYRLMPSDTAIQPLVIGDNHQALKLSQQLLEQDILVTAIRPPTVPENTARLRFTLSATHETSDIDHLVATLGKIFKP